MPENLLLSPTDKLKKLEVIRGHANSPFPIYAPCGVEVRTVAADKTSHHFPGSLDQLDIGCLHFFTPLSAEDASRVIHEYLKRVAGPGYVVAYTEQQPQGTRVRA